MTARMTITQRAEPGTRFARGAFDRSVGRPFTFNSPGDPAKTGTLVAAEVAPDGGSVALTIELDEMPTALRRISYSYP